MYPQLTAAALFDLSHTLAKPLLERVAYPWEALEGLSAFLASLKEQLAAEGYLSPAPAVWVHPTARVAPTAYLGPGVVLGPDTEVRHGAYLRENALVGAGAVVGNSTEVKNAILFDGVQVPHYNYVGDSILGHRAHLGAGALTSNVKSDRSTVSILVGDRRLDTDRRKLGAMLGDGVEVGCNAVLNPGTVVGRGSRVYPLSNVRGYVPAASIYKANGQIVLRQ